MASAVLRMLCRRQGKPGHCQTSGPLPAQAPQEADSWSYKKVTTRAGPGHSDKQMHVRGQVWVGEDGPALVLSTIQVKRRQVGGTHQQQGNSSEQKNDSSQAQQEDPSSK